MKWFRSNAVRGCLFVLAVGTAAPYAQAETAAQIVEKVRAALGIDAFEKQDKAVRLDGSVQNMGLTGTQTLLFDSAGRFRSVTDSQITRDTVFDGKTVRTRDVGGEVADEYFGDRTESLFSTWAATGLWFSREHDREFVLDNKTDEKNVILKIEFDEGRVSGEVTIDRATWRPTSWTLHHPVGDSTMTLKGEVRAGPLILPREIQLVSEHGSNLKGVVTNAELVPTPQWSVELASLKTKQDATFDSAVPSRLDVKKAPTGHLLVHPLVGGKDLGWFIFDTGAGTNVLEKRVIAKAKFETFGTVPAVGIGGATQASWCRPSTLQLGPITLHEPLTVVMNLSFLDQHMGVKVAGIIGYGTLARCLVELDLAASEINIHDSAKFHLTGADWSPLMLYNRVPCVTGRFEGHDAFFRLDTGAGGTMTFHAPTVERLDLLEGRKSESAMLGGVGGVKPARSAKVKWVEFGGKRHKKIRATFATQAAGAFADPYIDANIGGELIGKSVMIIDYPNSRIAFKWKSEQSGSESKPDVNDQTTAARAKPGRHSAHDKVAPTTPMEMVNDRPVIELRVQGKGPYRFVFDTGAGVTILTPELARELKIEATGKTRIGDPSAPHGIEVDTVNVDIGLCAENISDVPAVVWDDKAIFSALGDVHGIIGTAALPDYVVTLDFEKEQFRLSKEPLPNTDGTVHCDNQHGIPALDLSIGERIFPAQIDTGKSRDFSIPARLRNKLKYKSPPVSAQGRTANGEFDMEIATLDGTVKIAGCKIVDPELEITDRFRQGVVGTGVLRRFVIELDLAHERARFTPIPGWKLPESEKRRYGMMMSMGDGPVKIAGVVPGSIADRAGLKENDVVLKANGQDFEAMNFSERGKIARQSPLVLTVEREGQPIEIKLSFDDPPSPKSNQPKKEKWVEKGK